MTKSLIWSPQMEIELFHAIMSHKPVGVDRHFQMIYIKLLLNARLHCPPISTVQLWEKLDSLYNMEELHECEVNPFQSKTKEFSLPEEFSALKAQLFPRADSDPNAASFLNSADPETLIGGRSGNQKHTRKSLRSHASSPSSLASKVPAAPREMKPEDVTSPSESVTPRGSRRHRHV
ncbi:MRG-binding protein [Paragonimus westermani]|uniref:MRG-binding protein n=1 Tax=Paragonimus westermani TaxID=34504 RepID=A0A5J4NN18_9TREM|nr:MRG-binding protein [Paragonimus westermani]